MEQRKPYDGTCEECGNNRDGLCRMNGMRYTLPESGRCDYGHHREAAKCPVCGQSVNAEATIRALVEAMAKQRELCDICANVKTEPDPDCAEADCCCSECTADCACARCENGSNFRYGGVKNA